MGFGPLPLIPTPGEPTLPHGFYSTPSGWGGLTLTAEPQPIPFDATTFEVRGAYDMLPVRYDAASDRLWNDEGRLFSARVSCEWEAQPPTEAQVRAYADDVLAQSLPALGSLNVLQTRAVALAMSHPEVRIAADIGGALGEITQHDETLRFGATSKVHTTAYFGGATMRANGVQFLAYLPDPTAAPVRLVRAQLYVKVASSAEIRPDGS